MGNSVLLVDGWFRHSRISRAACLLLALGMALVHDEARAAAATWSATNIQYLYGDSHRRIEFDPDDGLYGVKESRSVITIEHVNEWKLGDNFLFIDITNPDRGDAQTPTSLYGEISPRLSFAKMTGKKLSRGLFKDVLLTSTLEVGADLRNYLYGVAVDLNIPRVPVFQINYYIREEATAATDTGSQVTLVWLYPFDIGPVSMAFEGFADYAFGLGSAASDNVIAAPRLMVDVGKAFGAPGMFQAGIEYQLWRNKFGIDGIDEDVAQFMVKWIW
jgi:nucleoside-specific outer membrane channel protein Tsx